MPQYFLHMSECGTFIEDETGSEFADLEEARASALRAARDVMCGEVKDGRLCLSCCVIVEDDSRHELARIRFQDAVAITGYTP